MGISLGRNLPKWARVALALVVAWDLAWKGVALWQAAKRRQPAWFAGLLVANTAGVLPIAYLVLMRRRDAAAGREPEETASEDTSPTDAGASDPEPRPL
jgi:hypothetical protein